MEAKTRLIQPGVKLTAINPQKITRLKNTDIVDLHDNLHELYQLGKKLDDQEVCQRAEQAHRHYVYEMLQRGINHPYLDTMDGQQEEEHNDSIMIALELPEDIGTKISRPHGENPCDMHITLAYLGKIDEFDEEKFADLREIIETYASHSKPMSGHVSGMGRFAASPSSDNRDVLYHSVDLPDLPAWRQGLIDLFEKRGICYNKNHGFTPHITVQYLERHESVTIGTQASYPVTFSEVMCKIGPDVYRYPLKFNPNTALHEGLAEVYLMDDNGELGSILLEMQTIVREALASDDRITESSSQSIDEMLYALREMRESQDSMKVEITALRGRPMQKTIKRDPHTGLITQVIESHLETP